MIKRHHCLSLPIFINILCSVSEPYLDSRQLFPFPRNPTEYLDNEIGQLVLRTESITIFWSHRKRCDDC
jgi:hypothetical protein